MERNPVTARLGRRLRLGVVGGGGATSVGEIHRVAARLDDRWEIVASVMPSGSRSPFWTNSTGNESASYKNSGQTFFLKSCACNYLLSSYLME